MKNSMFFVLSLLYFNYLILSQEIKGKGTLDDPFQIETIEQFQKLGRYSGGDYYILMNDIDASKTRYWNLGDHDGNPDTPVEPMGFTPITRDAFNLDGKGYVIKNLYINDQRIDYDSYSASVFLRFGGCRVSNLGIVDCDFTGYNAAGFCMGFFNSNIVNCFVTGKIKSTVGYASGFCSYVIYGDIYNSYAICDVTSKKIASSFCFGTEYFGDIYTCYAAGTINCPSIIQPFGTNSRGGDCFWDIETTGVIDSVLSDKFYGRTTAEMMSQSTYDNDSTHWEFKDYDIIFSGWCIEEGKSYPKLRVFGKCTGTDAPGHYVGTQHAVSLQVYPNPASERVNIKITPLFPLSRGDIAVYNVFGAIITNYKLKITNTVSEVDVSGLPAGVYYVMVNAGGQRLTKQFVVVY